MIGLSNFWEKQKYRIIFGIYIIASGALVFRVARQHSTRSIRNGQIEAVLKATTLAALIASIGASGNLNKPRSAQRE